MNLVEIDFLRGGQRLSMPGPLPDGDYFVFVGRGEQRPGCQVIVWSLPSPLPNIPIPLLPADREVMLDLADVFRLTYESAYFDRRLPHSQQLVPKSTKQQAAWIQERLHCRKV